MSRTLEDATEEVHERAGGDRTSPINHADPIADVLGFLEEVRVQKDCGSPVPDPADDPTYVVATNRVESARWLVQDDEIRISDERDGESEALLHAFGESADLVAAALGEADRLEDFVDCAP